MIRKLTSPFTEFGLLTGLLYSVDRLLGRLLPAFRLYFYELTVQSLTANALTSVRRATQLKLREIRPGDPEIQLMAAPAHVKEDRFRHGCMCLGAFRNDQLVGYIWFRLGSYDEDEVRCRFRLEPSTEAVFDFDLNILPEYRLGTAFMGLWVGAAEYLKSRGIRYSFSRVTRYNIASMRAHRRLGAQRLASAAFIKARRLQVMFATISPYFHISFRECSYPQFTLRPNAVLHE